MRLESFILSYQIIMFTKLNLKILKLLIESNVERKQTEVRVKQGAVAK